MMLDDGIRNLARAALASAVLLLAQSVSVRAQTRCPVGPFPPFVPGGTTNVEGATRVGQPCQMGFGVQGGTVQNLRITERPLHGMLGMAPQEQNRRFIAYAPAAGFVGRDRFEVLLQVVPAGRGFAITTRVHVEMNVTQ